MRTTSGLRIVTAVLVSATVLAVAASTSAAAKVRDHPGRPTGVLAVGVNEAIAVSWNAPVSNGGSPITGYTVTAKGKHTCSTTGATGCLLTGLKNAKQYAVSVKAANANGPGKASAKVKATPSTAQDCSYLGPQANLQGCDLAGFDLAGVDLTNANLTGADVSGTDLDGTTLTGTTLAGVMSGGITGTPTGLPANWVLIDGYLMGPSANLSDAQLADVNITGVDLTDADVSGADLDGTTMTGTTLAGVMSGGITGTPTGLPANWVLIDGYLMGPSANLSGAELAEVNINSVDLTDADLSGADLTRASLYYSSLPDANLSDTDLEELDGFEDDLTGANLAGADLSGAGVTNSSLKGADLTTVNLNGADISYDNLTNANLTGALEIRSAELINDTWSNTTCPDGTNSNNDGNTCAED